VQEYPTGELEPPKSEIVKRSLEVEDGFLIIPDAPGIGIELAEDAAERFPYKPRQIVTRLHVDGSVVDQ
jgi:galactonate dehydratase